MKKWNNDHPQNTTDDIQKGPLHNGNNVLLSTICMSNDYIHVQLILPRIREVIKLI